MIVVAILIGCLLVSLISDEINDLLFYWGNGWNWDLDRPNRVWEGYQGEQSSPESIESNYQRVVVGRPVTILGLTIILVVIVATLGQ